MTQYSLFDLPDDEADKIEAKKKEEKAKDKVAQTEKIAAQDKPPFEDMLEGKREKDEEEKFTAEKTANLEKKIVAEEAILTETVATKPSPQEKDETVVEETEEVIVAVEVITPVSESQEESVIDITSLGDIGRPQKTRKSTEKKSKAGRKSIQEMAASADLTQVPADDVLYQKQYYSIGAVAEMFRENVSLIRYWANEFKVVKPRTNKKGDRHFRPQDIKYLQLIYHLLREKKYTLEGAKDFLKNGKEQDKLASTINDLKSLKEFLLEMKASL